MQRYWWPGFEMQLLGELQRQQNTTQFCDTLLQTDGISVPTHSCILAALSPYLSQKLSASPSPPTGQKRQLQLQPVKAQTLLKLVGLLYSGEVEVKGSIEENDVLAVARLFGIRDLVEGHKNGNMEGELQERRQLLGSFNEGSTHANGRRREESRRMQDAQVQAEMAGRTDTDSPAENRRCVTTGTQTGEKPVSPAPAPESASSVAQSVDFPVMLQPQNITLYKQSRPNSCPVIPNVTSGRQNDGQSKIDQSSCSVINLGSTSALSNNMMTLPISLNDDSNSPTPLEDRTYHQSPECQNNIHALAKKIMRPEDDSRENAEEPHQTSRNEILGAESGKSMEKRHPHASLGTKNLAKMKRMQQMLDSTQISVKVKLRRRSKGEMWEVVRPRDTDETLSVLPSHKQDDSSHKEPRSNVEPPPSTADPDLLILQPPSSDCFTTNQRHSPGTAALPQQHGSVEESDEQIEKLLEDIMMGLNILPNLEKDCKKSHHLQPNHAEVCQVTENDEGHSRGHAAVSAVGCMFYQDTGTQSGQCSSDTGIHCCLTSQNQPNTRLVVQPDVALIQQQQPPQCSSQYHLSARSVGHKDVTSCKSMPLSKNQEYLHPGATQTRCVIASAFLPAGQKLKYPTFQEPPRQDSQHILECLPMVTDSETQSLNTVSLSCLDDLRVPPCLSPLEPCASATNHQLVLNQVNVQQQSSLHERPWLTENAGSLQFPLSTIPHLPQDTNGSLKQQQEQQNAHNGGTRVSECCTRKEVGERETISAAQQDVTELKSGSRTMKESLKCKRGDAAGDAVAPKQRKIMYKSPLQDAASSYKYVKVGDGTKGQISLSLCSVSLSSNNVLAREREMAASTSSPNIQSRFMGKLSQPSSCPETLREKTKTPEVKAHQTRIRTRGFMKKTQESPSNTSPQNSSVPIPVSVNNGDTLPRRKRGRPPKAKLEQITPPVNSPVVFEEKRLNEESREQINDLSTGDLEERDKAKRRSIKRKRSRSAEVEVKTENTAEPDANNNDLIPAVRNRRTPIRPQMVSLKEFQKLIKLQHSKTRKSKESRETNGESEGGQSGDGTSKESSNENHNHFFTESAAEEKSQQDDTDSSSSVDTTLFCDNPVFPCEAASADEREQSQKNPDEAGAACDAVALNTGQETTIKNKGSSHGDTHLAQESLCPQAADRTDPHLSDHGVMSRTSEEDEDVEVDVLLSSPDRAPHTRECESELNNMEVIPDEEEEEEDVNEIDVTGDEAE